MYFLRIPFHVLFYWVFGIFKPSNEYIIIVNPDCCCSWPQMHNTGKLSIVLSKKVNCVMTLTGCLVSQAVTVLIHQMDLGEYDFHTFMCLYYLSFDEYVWSSCHHQQPSFDEYACIALLFYLVYKITWQNYSDDGALQMRISYHGRDFCCIGFNVAVYCAAKVRLNAVVWSGERCLQTRGVLMNSG
jgi:hypothetical protein